jgi:hypothetical protein
MEVRRAVEEAEARIVGGAEGERVRAFLAGLSDELAPTEKLSVFNTMRRQEALVALSSGTAHLFLTPEDADLRIHTS